MTPGSWTIATAEPFAGFAYSKSEADGHRNRFS